MTADLVEELRALYATGARPPAAFIVESMMCCGGMVPLPEGYLRGMYEQTRAHGGLCIADEVQTGFGRVGNAFWAFEPQGVVPDIVTVGKPFGNGFPLAAVITTSELAEASNAFEYFNTFGGNPVACAVGLEVLSVIEDERLQLNALHTSAYAHELLLRVQQRQERVGDVRSLGLLLGVELVTDRHAKTPDPDGAKFVMDRMKELGVLVSTDGPFRNVLKMKPPICFSHSDAETVAKVMDQALSELPALSKSVSIPTARDIEDEEQLQPNGLHSFTHELLLRVQQRQERVGDVQSLGLQLGVEIVTDKHAKTPDPEGAKYVMGRLKEHGVLHISTDGPFRNVLKMKPTTTFNDGSDAETVAKAMDQALSELPVLNSGSH